MTAARIVSLHGRRVWDSRGRPTIEAEIRLEGGALGRAIAPAGASTGSGEAVDRRDGGPACGGLDVRGALAGFAEVESALRGLDATDQAAIDGALIALDGTPDKRRLGGNVCVAVSMATAHAAAAAAGVPLWRHLAGAAPRTLPLPEIQILGGGVHAGGRLDVQDFLVVAVGAPDYPTALDWTAEVYRAAGGLLADAGRLRGVADEGGFWPEFARNEDALELLVRATERAGLVPGEQVAIALDVAASSLGRGGCYRLVAEGRELDRDGLGELLLGWVARYPIVMIEDPFAEDDAEGFARFTAAVGARVQVIGDDLLVTDAGRVAAAARDRLATAVLIKPNQAGTLTEAKAAFDAAAAAGLGRIVSARSGESEDVTVVHLAVGWGAPQLKVGAIARGERTAKWNEGLRIAEMTGGALPPRSDFPWGRV